jgi:hypothetical protein
MLKNSVSSKPISEYEGVINGYLLVDKYANDCLSYDRRAGADLNLEPTSIKVPYLHLIYATELSLSAYRRPNSVLFSHKTIESIGQEVVAYRKPITVPHFPKNETLKKAESRLQFLANLDQSNAFEEFVSPSGITIREAGTLLRLIASLGSGVTFPDLGFDTDGTVVLTFAKQKGPFGSLSIFGDGTYSYYLEKDGEAIECDAALIAQPLGLALKNFLLR